MCWNKQTNIWQKKLGANHTHLLICRLLIFNHEQCRKGGLILGNISKEIKLLFITSITFPFFAFFCFDTLLKPLPNSKSYRFEVRRVGFDNWLWNLLAVLACMMIQWNCTWIYACYVEDMWQGMYWALQPFFLLSLLITFITYTMVLTWDYTPWKQSQFLNLALS